MTIYDKTKLIWRILTVTMFLAISEDVGANSESEENLREEFSALQLSRVKLRIKLLQENKSLRELNERIGKLQKQLAEQLESHPEMQGITRRIREVEQKLKDADSTQK